MSLPSEVESSRENDFGVLDKLKEELIERMIKGCRKLEKLEKALENKWGIKKEAK